MGLSITLTLGRRDARNENNQSAMKLSNGCILYERRTRKKFGWGLKKTTRKFRSIQALSSGYKKETKGREMSIKS